MTSPLAGRRHPDDQRPDQSGGDGLELDLSPAVANFIEDSNRQYGWPKRDAPEFLPPWKDSKRGDCMDVFDGGSVQHRL